MRFDDRLDTVLKIDPSFESGRITIWRQLVDMLSQSGAQMSVAAAGRCLAALALLRDQIPLTIRAGAITAIGKRPSYPPLIALLANDDPRIAVAAVDHARLTPEGWLAILPDLGPVGRSRLRQRIDVAPAVKGALAGFGSSDFALPSPEGSHAADDIVANATNGSEIAALVRRIDDYRHRKSEAEAPPVIAVRCDAEGRVRALAGANRARFVGLSIAEPARPTEPGCDAGVARAFGKRAPIRNGRLLLTDHGTQGATWLIDADPEFTGDTGRFVGYAGTLRPLRDVDGKPDRADIQPQLEPMADSMRQLVHELRSPLNAISGFAQIIHGQYFGPVGETYRQIAETIVTDSHNLAGALEDIDLAARLDSGRVAVDMGEAVFQAMLASRPSPLIPIVAPDEPITVAVDEHDLARVIQRMEGAIARIYGREPPQAGHLMRDDATGFAVLRLPLPTHMSPEALSNAMRDDRAIPDDHDSPAVLGPGFALRLVDQLAGLHGGSLSFGDSYCALKLPLIRQPQNQRGIAG